MLLVYGHHKYCIRQNLTSEDGPRTERDKLMIIRILQDFRILLGYLQNHKLYHT